MSTVEVRNLTKIYEGGVVAVKDANMFVKTVSLQQYLVLPAVEKAPRCE